MNAFSLGKQGKLYGIALEIEETLSVSTSSDSNSAVDMTVVLKRLVLTPVNDNDIRDPSFCTFAMVTGSVGMRFLTICPISIVIDLLIR
jgi:hypothetical protein